MLPKQGPCKRGSRIEIDRVQLQRSHRFGIIAPLKLLQRNQLHQARKIAKMECMEQRCLKKEAEKQILLQERQQLREIRSKERNECVRIPRFRPQKKKKNKSITTKITVAIRDNRRKQNSAEPKFTIKIPDFSQLVLLRINDKTQIYIRPDQDPEIERALYNRRQAAKQQYLKQ